MALKNFRQGRSYKTPINEKLNSQKPKSSVTMLSDYNWMFDYNIHIPEDEKQNYPKMIISEFQPVPNLGFNKLKNIYNKAMKQLSSIYEGASELKTDYDKSSSIGEMGGDNNVTVNDDTIAAGTDFMKNLLSGTFINVFEIPFLSSDYLVADGSDGWSADKGGGMFTEMINSLTSFLDGGGAPTMPTWKKEGLKGLSHSTEFYCVNDTLAHSVANFKFMHNVIQGAFWIQNKHQQLSPNLYQIEVPGRFKTFFASMKLSITFEGQVRRDDEFTSKVGLPSGALTPDAYKLNFEFTDLVDNNFNLYSSYMKTMQDAQSGSDSNFGQGEKIGETRYSKTNAEMKENLAKIDEAKKALEAKKAREAKTNRR